MDVRGAWDVHVSNYKDILSIYPYKTPAIILQIDELHRRDVRVS